MDDTGAVLEEIRRKVDRQERTVDQLRVRGAQLIGYGTVVAALFGIATAQRHEPRIEFATIAVGAFLAVLISVIGLELPRRFDFGVKLNAGIEAIEAGRQFTGRAVEVQLIVGYRDAYTENRKPLGSMFRWYQVALGAFAVQVVAWALALL